MTQYIKGLGTTVLNSILYTFNVFTGRSQGNNMCGAKLTDVNPANKSSLSILEPPLPHLLTGECRGISVTRQ